MKSGGTIREVVGELARAFSRGEDYIVECSSGRVLLGRTWKCREGVYAVDTDTGDRITGTYPSGMESLAWALIGYMDNN